MWGNSLTTPLPGAMHTHTCRNTHIQYCNTQSGGGKAKQPFGVNSWDGRDGCGRLYAERPSWEKTISVIGTGRVNAAACRSFILRCGSAGMPVSSHPRMSQRSGPRSLIYPRPVQDGTAGFDSEADIKQLLSATHTVGEWATLSSVQQTRTPPSASSLHCALICTGRNSYIRALKY